MEMLNSNQALMETNLQGAVAVAIVTAAKLETQTRLLLDSFGAPVLFPPGVKAGAATELGFTPASGGLGWLDLALQHSGGYQILCHRPPMVGKPGLSLPAGKGLTPWGAGGHGMSCGGWHVLAPAEQSLARAGTRGQMPQPWVRTCSLDAKLEGSLEDGEPQGCSSGMQSGTLSMGLECQVFAALPSLPCFPNRVDPLMDICAPSGTAAPRRTPRDLMVQGVQMRSLTPAGVEPCAAGAPWQEQPLLTCVQQAEPQARGAAEMTANIWGIQSWS